MEESNQYASKIRKTLFPIRYDARSSSHSSKHLFSYLRFANADSDDAEKVVKEIKACMGEGRAIFKAAKHAKFEKAAERKKNLAQFK